RAVGAAVEGPVCFHAVPDDTAATVRADGREFVDGAFEAVEHVRGAGGDYLKGKVIVVPAHLTSGHDAPPGWSLEKASAIACRVRAMRPAGSAIAPGPVARARPGPMPRTSARHRG